MESTEKSQVALRQKLRRISQRSGEVKPLWDAPSRQAFEQLVGSAEAINRFHSLGPEQWGRTDEDPVYNYTHLAEHPDAMDSAKLVDLMMASASVVPESIAAFAKLLPPFMFMVRTTCKPSAVVH